MQATTLKEKINLSHAKAIRRSRELLKLTRKEMASRLGISFLAVEKYERGKAHFKREDYLRSNWKSKITAQNTLLRWKNSSAIYSRSIHQTDYCSYTGTDTKAYSIYLSFWGAPQKEIRNNEFGGPKKVKTKKKV